MLKGFEVRWEGELPAAPEAVWDAITRHADGYLWPIAYEPRVGGSERGLTPEGGEVTAWEPARHFATRTERGAFNELDYRLEPLGPITYLRYVHRTEVPADDFERQLDACRRHTTFYHHSLGQYACHFGGRQATYVSVDGPAASAEGGFAALRDALGVPACAIAGDPVRLAGPAPADGVVDYATDRFLGVRTPDALHRIYGRDAWGWPAGVAHHLVADGDGAEAAWRTWVEEVFA